MADITDELETIDTNIYGSEVVQAIIDAVEILNELDVTTMAQFKEWMDTITPLLDTIDVMRSADSVYHEIADNVETAIDANVAEKVDASISELIYEALDDTIIDDIKSELLDATYPVGSIYMSMNNTNPASLFGGTWEAIGGRFLIGAGANEANNVDTYGSMSANAINLSANQKGGEPRHQLKTNEMPSHSHAQAAHSHRPSNTSYSFHVYRTNASRREVTVRANTSDASLGYGSFLGSSGWGGVELTDSRTPAIQNTGGGENHNNMPPYLVVYMWQRTA